MPINKTTETSASVADYLTARGNEQQRIDCGDLIALLQSLTQQPPRMWGPSIVGFGLYRYTYPSGHSGEAPLAGFAIRGREIVLYLSCERVDERQLLAQLGPHRMGKCCLYFKRLGDLNTTVLEELVTRSIAYTMRSHEPQKAV